MARVLVVDDEPQMRHVLRRFLESDGHEVHEAANGAQALAVLQETNIQIAFVDMLMPVMDGMGLIRRMHERFPDTRVVAMSTATDILDLPGREMKIEQVLEKPFTRKEALNALERALS